MVVLGFSRALQKQVPASIRVGREGLWGRWRPNRGPQGNGLLAQYLGCKGALQELKNSGGKPKLRNVGRSRWNNGDRQLEPEPWKLSGRRQGQELGEAFPCNVSEGRSPAPKTAAVAKEKPRRSTPSLVPGRTGTSSGPSPLSGVYGPPKQWPVTISRGLEAF